MQREGERERKRIYSMNISLQCLAWRSWNYDREVNHVATNGSGLAPKVTRVTLKILILGRGRVKLQFFQNFQPISQYNDAPPLL